MQKISSLLPLRGFIQKGNRSTNQSPVRHPQFHHEQQQPGQSSQPWLVQPSSAQPSLVHRPSYNGGTTPVPNGLLDSILPTLSDTELRVLLIVVRSTLGWRDENNQNSGRKTRDWISHHQFQQRTGRAGAAVSKAIDDLVRRGLLLVQDEMGQDRMTTKERRMTRGRLWYQLRPDWRLDWKPDWKPGWEKASDGAPKANPTVNHVLPQWNSRSGLHQAKTTKEIRTKEISTKGEKLTEIKIDLSSLKSEVITIDLQGLVPASG